MTSRCCSGLALLFTLALAPAAQTTWYVDDDGVGGAGTAAEPFCTIQEGIDAALQGDLVLVLPGTYYETIDFLGKDITVRSAEGPAATVVDGSFGYDAVVLFRRGEGPGAVLDGFTIQRGYSRYIRPGGGGIFCRNASPTIAYNVIRWNYAELGGGIYLSNAVQARILYNVIQSNDAAPGGGLGGGIYAEDSDLRIVGNILRSNNAFGDPEGYGGGLFVTGGTVTIEHNLVAENTAIDYGANQGGGIFLAGTEATLDGNTIVDNWAFAGSYGEGLGGGIACYGGSSPVRIKNTVLWGNVSTLGEQLYVGGGRVGVVSSDVQSGRSGCYVTSSGVLGWGAANLATDPGFAGPDYHLLPSSPLIDAGVPTATPGGVDADGDPRILDGLGDGLARVDIGWDELNRTTLAATGSATLGGTLTLTTTAAPDGLYVLVTGERRGDLSFGPLGSLLVDPDTLQIVALGTTPATNFLTLPAHPSLAGTGLYAQSLAIAFSGSPGSFSNRLRFVLAPTPAAP